MPVARRILILGPNGSGKSTLARLVGDRLGIPVVHIDALYWKPGWIATDSAAFRARIADIVATDRWVMDGSYASTLDLRLPRADAVIWLDLPRHVYFARAVWRSIRNFGRERADVGPGNREKFEVAFFRDFVWTYPHRRRGEHAKLMSELPGGVCSIALRSSREVAAFAKWLPFSLETSHR